MILGARFTSREKGDIDDVGEEEDYLKRELFRRETPQDLITGIYSP